MRHCANVPANRPARLQERRLTVRGPLFAATLHRVACSGQRCSTAAYASVCFSLAVQTHEFQHMFEPTHAGSEASGEAKSQTNTCSHAHAGASLFVCLLTCRPAQLAAPQPPCASAMRAKHCVASCEVPRQGHAWLAREPGCLGAVAFPRRVPRPSSACPRRPACHCPHLLSIGRTVVANGVWCGARGKRICECKLSALDGPFGPHVCGFGPADPAR